MLESIVHIESSNKNNKSFGTGFIIDTNETGVYILTCQHVIAAVEEAVVESHVVEVISQNDFFDMAIVFVPSPTKETMLLQLEACPSLTIKSVVFSSFKKNLVQKSTIHATLFKNFIELHSTEDDTFYLIKKIKADPDYHFSKGNSGAPIICKQTEKVIAMLSNKEGDDMAYAIGVSSLKKLLLQIGENPELFKSHEQFYNKMSSFKEEAHFSMEKIRSLKNKAIYHINELQQKKGNMMQRLKEKSLKLKYFFLGILTIFALYGAYSFFNQNPIKANETTIVIKASNKDTH